MAPPTQAGPPPVTGNRTVLASSGRSRIDTRHHRSARGWHAALQPADGAGPSQIHQQLALQRPRADEQRVVDRLVRHPARIT